MASEVRLEGGAQVEAGALDAFGLADPIVELGQTVFDVMIEWMEQLG